MRQQQRLVVDVEPHQLGVGDVDDRLADAWRSRRPPRRAGSAGLVEAVDEGAVLVGRRGPPRGCRACRGSRCRREERLGDARGRRGRSSRSTSRHGSTREAAAVERVGSRRVRPVLIADCRPGDQLGEVVDDDVGAVPRSASSAPAPRSTPTTSPKPPAAPGLARPRRRPPRRPRGPGRRRAPSAAYRKVSGAGLPGSPCSRGDGAVDDGREAVERARRRASTSRARSRERRDDRHPGAAGRRSASSSATEPG